MIIVVAGGIGTGKSTVMKILEDLGAKVIYADAINRELLLDEQYVKKIGENFDGVVKDGVIDKKALRNIIFNDEEARLRLNSIAHPLIFNRINDLARSSGLIFVEIPLFVECSSYIKYDKLCAILASISIRAERVAKRDNISIESALKIIEAQIKEEKVYESADFIIYNNKDIDYLREQVILMYNNVR